MLFSMTLTATRLIIAIELRQLTRPYVSPRGTTSAGFFDNSSVWKIHQSKNPWFFDNSSVWKIHQSKYPGFDAFSVCNIDLDGPNGHNDFSFNGLDGFDDFNGLDGCDLT